MDHDKLNQWLSTVALVLGIALMLAVMVLGTRVYNALTPDEPPASHETCYDPGGGTVCAP